MTKTRFNTFTSRTIVIGLCIFIVAITMCLFNIYSDKPAISNTIISTKGCLYISLLGLIIFTFIVYRIKMVLIDYISQQIIVKNRITRQVFQYHFSELDGYYNIAINHSTKTKLYTKAIGIAKDNKVIILIDSYYCSNLTEMRNGLDKLKYLGVDSNWEKQKFNII